MDDWLKRKYDSLSKEKKEELLETVTLAPALSNGELAAYLGIIPMTQTLFNGIADACATQENYAALFRLFHRYESMMNDYLRIDGSSYSDSQY